MGAGTTWVVSAWWGVLFLCRRGQGQELMPGLDPSPSAQFPHREGSFLRCCSLCNSTTKSYPSQQLRGCTCAMPGELCGDPDCKTCTKFSCKPGEKILVYGKFRFKFECKECEYGTYSDGIDGSCLPWTDCSRNGFLTVRPGNRTHNVLCGMGFPSEPGLFNSYSIPMVILTSIAILTFIIVSALLSFHIWWVKKETLPKDKEAILTLGPGPPDDIGNCPFPEEEWGERTVEDKTKMSHPWV